MDLLSNYSSLFFSKSLTLQSAGDLVNNELIGSKLLKIMQTAIRTHLFTADAKKQMSAFRRVSGKTFLHVLYEPNDEQYIKKTLKILFPARNYEFECN
jgi:hypothetical protein